MSFNTNKCKVIHVGSTNRKFSYVTNGQISDTVYSDRDLDVMISSDLKSSNQCIHACSKASAWHDKKDN